MRVLLSAGIILAALAVMLGAFGAHALADQLGTRASTWNTAVTYQMFHSLALIVTALIGLSSSAKRLPLYVGGAFLLGILAFSGSLYFISLTHATNLGVYGLITPLGGLLFILGWFLLLAVVLTTNFNSGK